MIGNFDWVGYLLTGGASAAIAMVLATWLKGRAPLRKQEIDREISLVDALNERVNKVEADLERERDRIRQMQKDYDEKIEKITQAYDLKIEKLSAGHDAVVAIMRHRVNNLTASLDALLMLLEQDPTRAQEAVSRIKEMRARQETNEAAEKAALHATKIGTFSGTLNLDGEVT